MSFAIAAECANPKCAGHDIQDELDRYTEPSGQITHLKTKCRACGCVQLLKL